MQFMVLKYLSNASVLTLRNYSFSLFLFFSHPNNKNYEKQKATRDANVTKSVPTWLQMMKRFCRLSDHPFPKLMKNTKISCCHLNSSEQVNSVGWMMGISLKWCSNKCMLMGNVFPYLFSCKTQNARVRDNEVAGIPFSWLTKAPPQRNGPQFERSEVKKWSGCIC